jgi:hypothetical protein
MNDIGTQNGVLALKAGEYLLGAVVVLFWAGGLLLLCNLYEIKGVCCTAAAMVAVLS